MSLPGILSKYRDQLSSLDLVSSKGRVKYTDLATGKSGDQWLRQVLSELDAVPAAVTELDQVFEAREELAAFSKTSLSGGAKTLPVANGRELPNPSLATNGFLLLDHTSKVENW